MLFWLALKLSFELIRLRNLKTKWRTLCSFYYYSDLLSTFFSFVSVILSLSWSISLFFLRIPFLWMSLFLMAIHIRPPNECLVTERAPMRFLAGVRCYMILQVIWILDKSQWIWNFRTNIKMFLWSHAKNLNSVAICIYTYFESNSCFKRFWAQMALKTSFTMNLTNMAYCNEQLNGLNKNLNILFDSDFSWKSVMKTQMK